MVDDPFAKAGIDGYLPPQPFISMTAILAINNTFHWPTLHDYNVEMME